ncbi:DUF3500 domain-containing protein [Tuwongella immobilis]|uniref:DUF3500 domain-containing protein n=1 Tax=Tuwongella immobilis TaxID=692036 RepID=A0A6C2YSD0_9BACT|nr:DUF3500 domain-containing protein [Tuwongella immobilis]VIP04043.1 Uncharacterized protein OS=Chthoniobacter flavus Ellin428 GN=CfE428DRAFT_3322 PE=4 SV=1: DUF3500 [Tuwongella immobilis]VTS05453.1 Uncharacterized protein OS=Chthoniobacter flavus Ellin428 GN=CfE428DRAFT_3322 PE=4 SV=1: DUF3500 [Tuwongella immobilis]
MRILSLALLVSVMLGIPRTGHAADAPTGSGAAMTTAASKLLAALPPELQKKATFSFADDERFNWHFIPLQNAKTKQPTRKGVPLEDMPEAAKGLALELVKAGVSAEQYATVLTIFSREAVIGELEPANRWFRRPGWYFVSIFGEPSLTSKWGWRIEGHHLSLNFTIDKGVCTSATPAFYGMNPVTMKHGPTKGERVLGGCEDLGRELFLSLSPDQQKLAHQAEHFPEVEARTAHYPDDKPLGIPGSKLTPTQQEKLGKLIRHYLERLPADQAKHEWAKIEAKGFDNVVFGYSGEPIPFKEHTYRVQGADFLIHYMNNQTDPLKNPANHIHSVFRTISGDFGGVPK